MEKFDLYKDIQKRTNGEIYVGVVGPVRTGKSTFVRKFMQHFVLPQMEDQKREMANDELPASASGRMVTTVEPKFVPRDAVEIEAGDGSVMQVRLVDCIGYLVPGAEGTEESGTARMVKTPWQEQPVTFAQAANIGTKKVITDHATIGIVVTTDGSFGELPRGSFYDAEREAITQLKKIGKPFLVIVNSSDPYGEPAKQAAAYLEREYQLKPLILNCDQMGRSEIFGVFEQFLLEFPLTKVVVQIPKWAETLGQEHWLKQELLKGVRTMMQKLHCVRDVYSEKIKLDVPDINKVKVEQVSLADGTAELSVQMQDALYFDILSEMTGTQIESEYQLISLVKEMAQMKREYETVSEALRSVRETGYGVISPQKEEIQVEEPMLIRQGSRFGVRVRASAPSVHLVRAEAQTEIAPIVGSEEQAQDLISYISSDREGGGWNTLIFGKSVEQMIGEGIQARVLSIGEDSQRRLQEVMKKIVNKSHGKLMFIII